jgi:CheY-like chemotaxis protein
MIKPIKILYVDDDPTDSERYSHCLEDKGSITIIPVQAPEHPAELFLEPAPDLALIDYRLIKHGKDTRAPTYRGGTLINYIAEKNPKIPLAIFSTHDILRVYPNYEKEIQAADLILYKEEITEKCQYWKNYLVQYVNDFEKIVTIKSHSRTWKNLQQLLNATNNEVEELQRANPPRKEDPVTWDPHDLSRWVLRVLFRYPGIFYNSLYASTALGITEDSFLSKKVQELFAETRYDGIFSQLGEGFWWRNRLQESAFKFIREAGFEPNISENFEKAFKKTKGAKLNPSICIFSKEEHANTICYLLGKPVKRKYSLEYLPDNRPESMETARISFKAVIEEDINKYLLPPSEAERMKAIRRNYKK